MASVPTLHTSLLILSITIALHCHPVFSRNILYTTERLLTGQSLENGNYTLTMQGNCNLVLYDRGKATWASGTTNRGSGCYLTMQSDRNLVIYNSNNGVVWASNTWTRAPNFFILVLQDDGDLAIYGPRVWNTGTSRKATDDVTILRNETNIEQI